MSLCRINGALPDERRMSPYPRDSATNSERSSPAEMLHDFPGVIPLLLMLIPALLTALSVVREKEMGAIANLHVTPVTPFEIMTSKIWAMALVVLVACAFALVVVVRGLLPVPIEGPLPLFLAGTALNLFATPSMGIFMGTVARSMPQFGLLLMLVLMPLQMLSGGSTPRESMPGFAQTVMLAAPTIHFVLLAQAILYRGAGLDIVWPRFIGLAVIRVHLLQHHAGPFPRPSARWHEHGLTEYMMPGRPGKQAWRMDSAA